MNTVDYFHFRTISF